MQVLFTRRKRCFCFQTVDFTTYAGKFLNVDRNNVRGLEFGLKYKINEMLISEEILVLLKKAMSQPDCVLLNKELMHL
jgi:hypothetical protein